MLFAVTALRGFPLGEHLVVGWHESSLYRELLHVPLLIRYPDLRFAMRRDQNLVEPWDLARLLQQWFSARQDPASVSLPFPPRTFSISRRGDETLLRTRAWHARFPQLSGDGENDLDQAELFLKPDDQWEVNDVSARCPEVAEAAWQFTRTCLANPTTHDRIRVPDILQQPSP